MRKEWYLPDRVVNKLFPSPDAAGEGFELHAVIDASGAVSGHERGAT